MSNAFKDFGEVKKVKGQTSIVDPEIFTGTRLVSMVLKSNPPRSLLIGGYLCRVWYRGQPLVCNLCGVQGHKSANCPNKQKCRLCRMSGHFARQCRNAWDQNARAAALAADQGDPAAGSVDTLPSGDGSQPGGEIPTGDDAVDDDDFQDASSVSAEIGAFTSSRDFSSPPQKLMSSLKAKVF